MAKEKVAAKKTATKKAPAKSAEPKEPNMGQSAAPAAELNSDAKVSKDKSTIEGTGKFEVVEISKDNFRMFNELGQAVSPVVVRGDVDDNGKNALSKLQRQAARSNALRKSREVRTPRGHQEA